MVARTEILRNIIAQVTHRDPRPFIVAGAGNEALPALGYPSRFADVIAVGAVTLDG